jgi:hypothetical protein
MLSKVRRDVQSANTLVIGEPAVIRRHPTETDPFPLQDMSGI